MPTALIEAAGFLPFRLYGDPQGGQPRSMPRGPSDVRSDLLEFANSWVHLIAGGRYDFVDHFVVSNSRKYILQLVERLRAISNPPSVHILDRAVGQSDAARDFNRAQVLKLRRTLESWSGSAFDSTALADAVRRYNRRAAEMMRIAGLRERPEPRLSGLDAIRAIAIARWMHSADFLEQVTNVTESPPLPGVPLFLSGSGQDQDIVYAAAEMAGAIIVGECHPWSARLLEQQIGDGDPFDAVAEHYARNADFVVPLREWTDVVAQRFKRSGAHALLNFVYAHDDGMLWEGPSQTAVCAGPHVMLAGQPYRVDTGAIADAVADLCRAWAA
ncbi:MAG TPA: 2-hydroxyacyl-CoA dehydratase family protein [Sphingomonadaceae bacterium]|nr:2-hydroxyacyl-CoA dehydratase family protein [Sphingomonadaceae bacterium]